MKQKRLAKIASIPCSARDTKSAIQAEDDSLAENMRRVALHPLDQFRVFVCLCDKGRRDADIAAAFFLIPEIVKQCLKLVSVAPALLEVYAKDRVTLEQLMAFFVNPDYTRQVEVWNVITSFFNKEPFQIRRMLIETSVRVSDRSVVFVDVEAYEGVCGTMLQDLFQSDDGDWRENTVLLDPLVTEKLLTETVQAAPDRHAMDRHLVCLSNFQHQIIQREVGFGCYPHRDPVPQTGQFSMPSAITLSSWFRVACLMFQDQHIVHDFH